MLSKYKTYPLGNFIEQIRGVSYKKSDVSEVPKEGYIPLLRANNIQAGKLVFSDVIYVKKELVKDNQLIKKGDIVIAASSGSKEVVGKSGQAHSDYDCSFGAFCKLIRAKENINPRFLGYFFKTDYYSSSISNSVNGANINNLRNEHIDNLLIPIPSISTQEKIANVLDKAQELIDKRKAQIEALDQLTKSVFLEMFGDPVANKTWERRPLKDITDVRDGTHDSPKYVPSGYPLVTSKNIKNGKIDLSNVNYISEEDFININKRSKVDIGDIIMPMIGTIGNPIIVDEQPNFAIKNVALIKFNNPCVINIYIKYLLDSHYLDYILNKNKRGGTQKFLSLTDIRNMEIPLPPRDLQAKFSEIVKKVDSQKAILHKSLTELENNFNSLMQRAFKGELFND
jgi:type I restriction enzyme S subunit